jgi:hypothetical protein
VREFAIVAHTLYSVSLKYRPTPGTRRTEVGAPRLPALINNDVRTYWHAPVVRSACDDERLFSNLNIREQVLPDESLYLLHRWKCVDQRVPIECWRVIWYKLHSGRPR